jgi:sulfur carrier protein ThiS adenylyltransferase
MSTDGSNSSLFARNVPGMTERLGHSVVGIAGCGGLGSNAAVALTRAGIGTLILADPDIVQESDLNRQHFFRADIGKPKLEALTGHLRAINPEIQLETHTVRIEPAQVPALFAEANLLIEAFDSAESKEWLIEAWCAAFPDRPIVCASGLAGLGDTHSLRVRSSGSIHFCGDGESDASMGLCSARVAIVANMQANTAIELLMRGSRD